MTERIKRLLELNKNMDQIIELAKIETERMENEIKIYEEEALNKINRALHEIYPIMDAVCKSLRVNQYEDTALTLANDDYYKRYVLFTYGNVGWANYGLIVVRHGIDNYKVSLWDDEIRYSVNCGMSERQAIADAREFITENVNELVKKLYYVAEELLQSAIERKAVQQKNLQNNLQTKLEMYKRG